MQLSRYRPASYAGKLKDCRARNFYSRRHAPYRNKARHPQWIISRALLIFNNRAMNSAPKSIYNYKNPTPTVNAAAFIFSVQLHVQFHLNPPVEIVCQRLISRAIIKNSASRHSKNPPQAGYFFLPARDFRCAASFMWPICRVIHQSCVPAYLLIISYSFLSCDILCSLTPPAPLPPSLFSAYSSSSPCDTFHFPSP
jgi:hypothetical protein